MKRTRSGSAAFASRSRTRQAEPCCVWTLLDGNRPDAGRASQSRHMRVRNRSLYLIARKEKVELLSDAEWAVLAPWTPQPTAQQRVSWRTFFDELLTLVVCRTTWKELKEHASTRHRLAKHTHVELLHRIRDVIETAAADGRLSEAVLLNSVQLSLFA